MQPDNYGPAPVSPVPTPPIPPPPRTPVTQHSDGLKNVFATLAILIAAPLVALFITSFLFQSYEVFGPSMQSTLHNGDRLIVLKAPRTFSKLLKKTYMPSRGQVVIFTKADLAVENSEGSKQLIKRVMALPGERVVVKDGILTVYNDAKKDGFQPDKEGAYGSVITQTGIDGEWTVGKGQVFVAGDNRDNSLDSRTFGPINTDDIVGTAAFRFLPIKQTRTF